VSLQQKGPLILRPDDDFTKAPKGRPDVVPTPSAPAPMPTPATPEAARTADASTLPKAPGSEGLRLPPGIGRDLSSGAEGSKASPSRPTGPSIASSLRNFDDKLQTGELGIPMGSGEQQIHGLKFDPMGADFSKWVTQFTREVYRNWIMPQPALMGMRGHVDIEFRVERDGSLSLCQVLNSSTNVAMDRSAKNALESSLFLPLPDDFGPPSVTMRASFFYNEAPSGS
jgi:TonB family protein